MIGICLEVSTSCTNCKSKIHLNALVSKVWCHACGANLELTSHDWMSVIGDPIKEAPNGKEGEGSHTSCFAANYNFSIMAGRQAPRFGDTKTPMDMDQAEEAARLGYMVNPETGSRWSVRRVPEAFSDLLEGVKFLLCEDPAMLSRPGGEKFSLQKAEPQAYTCPQCAGSLTVDGTTRNVECNYCNNVSFLSDEIWLRLHPVETLSRWYLWYDEKERVYDWDDAQSVAVEKSGVIYMATQEDWGKNVIVCLEPSLKPRWVQRDLGFQGEKTRIALTERGLWVCNDMKPSLYLLSTRDGTIVETIGGKTGKPVTSGKFSMKDVQWIVPGRTGNLLVSQRVNVKNHGSATELWRMDLRGNRLPLWTEEDGTEIPCKVPAGGPTYLDKLGIAPRYCLDSDVALSEGGDGSVVLCASDRIVRYHRNGTPLYNAKMPFRLYYTSLPYMDVEGYVYVLCESNSSCFVARVDPKGTQMETWLANYRCGGPVVDGTFVRREDGVYCFFDSGTRLTMVRDDQTVISRTPKAQKDLQEKRKKWEKDQD